jgi:hypothetical protein
MHIIKIYIVYTGEFECERMYFGVRPLHQGKSRKAIVMKAIKKAPYTGKYCGASVRGIRLTA